MSNQRAPQVAAAWAEAMGRSSWGPGGLVQYPGRDIWDLLRSLPYSPLFRHYHYLPYPGIELPTSLRHWSLLITTLLILKHRFWSRPMHSLMAIHHLDPRTALWLSARCLPHVHLMSISWTALWLFTSCLPHVYLMVASCSPHADSPLPCISHSLASRRLMYFISTLWPLSVLILASRSPHVIPHVFLMARIRPIGYDPLI